MCRASEIGGDGLGWVAIIQRSDGLVMRRVYWLSAFFAATWIACVLSCVGGPAVRADEPRARADRVPASVGTRRALIICGLPGDAAHRKLFGGCIEKLHNALTVRCGFANSEILVRFGEASASGDGPALAAARGLSNREGIAAAVDEMRRRLKPDDTLWVIVVGHCHFDGRHSHLNIPGPDLDEREFARLFEGLAAREQVFWITTSASGFFLKPLAASGRIVITATEPDQEVNETLFPLALADILDAPPDDIDRDKDGRISLLELYLAVVADVLKRYVDAENLPTEHARLDDNGDGRGTELQEDYLPPELLGRIAPGSSAKAKSDSAPARAPQLKPDSDGARASKVQVAASPKDFK
jgi:hypothetical protein